MINSIHIQNFKCLRDVKVDLEPFTVLIGPNDSGKSSILDALNLVGQLASRPWGDVFRQFRPASSLAWRGRDADIAITVQGVLHTQRFNYRVELPHSDSIPIDRLDLDGLVVGLSHPEDLSESFQVRLGSQSLAVPKPVRTALAECLLLRQPPAAVPVAASLASVAKHRLVPQDLRRPSPLTPSPTLTESGDNLGAVLDAIITGPDRSAINSVEESLRKEVPSLKGVSLQTVGSNGSTQKAVRFALAGHEKPPVTIPADAASEGVLLLTAFLALVYGESPDLLLIEEPENGLHPTRLHSVVTMLRKITTGELGNKKRQVIITTHSPLLLNYVRPEEVRIFRRHPESGTEVTPMMKVPDIDKLLKDFGLGELWYLLTEEGLLKGEKP